MTTTIKIDTSTTLTSLVTATETAVVQGLLDVSVTTTNPESPQKAVSSEREIGVTLANRVVSSISKDSEPSTISTFVSSSTSTLTTSNASTTSSIPRATSTYSSSHKIGTSYLSSSTGSNANIGLVIGIPVGIIGSVIFCIVLYYYLRSKKKQALDSEKRLQTYYDENFNYKAGTYNMESHSPIKSKTVYQLKPQPNYHNYRDPSSVLQNSIVSNSEYNLPTKEQSVLSLKVPPTGPVSSKWNLNTPLSKWFMKHTTTSNPSSRASLSTGGPFSPVFALKEFKLNKKRADVDEESPILPKFPETSYHPSRYNRHAHNTSYGSSTKFSSSSSSNSESIKEHVIITDSTISSVPHIQPIPKEKRRAKHINKPLPKKPQSTTSLSTSTTSLEGLEKMIYERTIPTTPKVDVTKYKNDAVYKVCINYSKKLADELTIVKGEYVKILARHTDGWCLGEKVDSKGNSLFEGNGYIHDGRGVFPEMCLQKV